MTVLLLDAGNSRLKWRWQQGQQVLAEGAAAYDQLPNALARWQGQPASRIEACNVAGPHIAAQLEALCAPSPINWLKPQPQQAGVRNGYRDHRQLGADRWAALIAVRGMQTEQDLGDCLIAVAGTALTIDALTSDGDFLGGLIVPGYRLMRQALATGTADLGHPEGALSDFPHCTGEAIVNGAVTALCGAIELQLSRLAALRGGQPTLLLSGGDGDLLATILQPRLEARLRRVDNLVLAGLSRLATAETR